MSGGNYNRPNSRGSSYGYRGGQREYPPTDFNGQQQATTGYRGGYRGYQQQQPSASSSSQGGGYHYPPQQPQQGYDDYNGGYDYRYGGHGYRGGRGGSRGRGGYYSSSRVASNGGVQPYGYQSNHHPYTPPISHVVEPVSKAVEVVKRPVEVEKPIDLSEKHWIERLHVEGDDKKSLSGLFDELDKVNNRLDQVTIRRLDLEVEVMKLNRFSKTGEERCKMSEEQLESMNL